MTVYVTPLSDAEPGPEDFFINFFFKQTKGGTVITPYISLCS